MRLGIILFALGTFDLIAAIAARTAAAATALIGAPALPGTATGLTAFGARLIGLEAGSGAGWPGARTFDCRSVRCWRIRPALRS